MRRVGVQHRRGHKNARVNAGPPDVWAMVRSRRSFDFPGELLRRQRRHPPYGVIPIARTIGIDDAKVLGEPRFDRTEISLHATGCCGQERDTNQTCPDHPAIMRLLRSRGRANAIPHKQGSKSTRRAILLVEMVRVMMERASLPR